GLVAMSPILFCTALLIRVESQGSIIFRQRRVGQHGHEFDFYKFRSMRTTADPRYRAPDATANNRDGVCAKYREDPRLTRVGKIIRKYSIDELPQLWNVVRGDMALVGPRPALTEETDCYMHTELNRLNVMPGLTGLWQVSGRADTSFAEQVHLDVDYIQRQSWQLDLTILLRTLPAVLSTKGAY
ncbi:MAG: sugar transferase, partial [Pseudomonadota bacterium]